MIRIGTAGIPVGCKDGNTISSLKYLKEIGLDAMEVEFVRGVGMGWETAKEVGKTAEKLGITLSVHAPYFINLASDEKQKVTASEKRIMDSAEIGGLFNAKVVVFHPGFYSKEGVGETKERITSSIKSMREKLDEKGIKTLLGLETTGRQKQFGSLEETLDMCSNIKGILPVLDFAHIHARGNGCLKRRDDFSKIFDTVEKALGKITYHIHMTGIHYEKGNERRHETISSREPDFRLLAEEIIERRIDATIISESPNLEADALAMKRMLGI